MLFTLSATLLTIFEIRPTVLVIFLCMIGMGIAIVVFCYGYFKEQNEIMETAVAQITEYISGNHKARIFWRESKINRNNKKRAKLHCRDLQKKE